MARWIGSWLVILCLSGCGSGGSVNPPDGRIRALNLVSTQASVNFLRVERVEGTLVYKQNTGFIVADSDTYNFNIEITAPGATDPTRVASFPETIEADRDYTFVITEPTPNNYVVVTLDRDVADAPAGETAIDLIHLASNFGSVDIYLEAPGTPLVGATPFADAVSPSNTILQGTVTSGDYVISVTPVGTPGVPLFTSTTVTLADGDRILAAVADSAGTITSNASVLLISSQSNAGEEIFDVNATAELRLVHAGPQAGPLDLVVDDDFAMPLHGAVPAASATAYATIASGSRNLKITPAGIPSTIELDETANIPVGLRSTILVAGELGNISAAQEVDNLQVIPGAAILRLFNGATAETSLSVFIVPPGTDIVDVAAVIPNFPVGISPYLQFLPDDYELVLAEPGTTNAIGSPIPFTLQGSSIYGIVIVDDPANRVSAIFIDDFVP